MATRGGFKQFIKYLNEVHKLDPDWLETLMRYRTPCNREIVTHPSIQAYAEEGFAVAGFLGLINGYYGTLEGGANDGCGPVAACFDDETGKLVGFQVFDRSHLE